MRVLVTGGAGYIGAITAARLVERGHQVVVWDDLSHGHRDAVPAGAELVVGDVLDGRGLGELCRARAFEGLVHFAGLIEVGESVAQPARYWRVNAGGAATTFEAFAAAGGRVVVFSSTAAVYGTPRAVPIAEDHPLDPRSPYGASKAAVETLLASMTTTGIRSVALRYFNAAGASDDGARGERHEPESHLVPRALAALAGGPPLVVHGDDWDTPDGTCIRDFVHVEDLAEAHVAALALAGAGPDGSFEAFNVGSGTGHSVRQILDAIAAVVGREVPAQRGPRRPGDVARLVARIDRARERLGWAPERSDVPTIVQSAWRWVRGAGNG